MNLSKADLLINLKIKKLKPTLYQISTLFSILYPYENLLLIGIKKSDPNINEYLHSFIELSDVYYYIININEPKELVKYFYQKLK